MYSLETQPISIPTIRNKMVRNEPNTRLVANMVVLQEVNFFYLF